MNNLRPEPTDLDHPLGWLRLAKQTRKADLRRYPSKNEPLSLKRLWAGVAPNLRQPIFLIGSPRSGTTFLGQCLAALPEVSYHFEPPITKTAARYIYQNRWDFSKARLFYRQAYGWLMRLHFDGHLRFAEKTPRNCFILSFLYRAFPDAQFIHIIRDGRDAALSHSQKPWLQAASANSGKRETGGYPYGPYARFWVEPDRRREFETTTDLHRCIWAWRRHTTSALAQARHLPPAHYHELRYEALIANPQAEAERLLDYLGLSPAESRRRFFEAVGQAKPNSVGRWRIELSKPQLEVVEAEAGPLLERLGYPAGEDGGYV